MNLHIVATAINTQGGGGRVIVEQALSELKVNENVKKIYFYSPEDFDFSEKKIWINVNHVQRWIVRLVWEKILFDRHIQSGDIVVSFQNTLPSISRQKKIKSILYLHQSLPFIGRSLVRFSTEREFRNAIKGWLYIFFIKNSLFPDTNVVVQTQWMKEAFIEKVRHPKGLVYKLTPPIPVLDEAHPPTLKSSSEVSIPRFPFFFYPATYQNHKNHEKLIEGFALFTKRNQNVNLLLTINQNTSKLKAKIKLLNLSEKVSLIGFVSRFDSLRLMQNCSALVFPSLAETLGLPLIEAAQFKVPIIASDLPYSREVLKNYDLKEFFNPFDSVSIAQALEKFDLIKGNGNFKFLTDDWNKFWSLLEFP